MDYGDVTLRQLDSMAVVVAMRRKAPLESGVVNIPVQIPLELYRRVSDLEHDDCVEFARFIGRAVLIMHRDLLPMEGFDGIVESAMRLLSETEYWIREETDHSLEDGLVTVCVPLPQKFFGQDWSHWLGVEIGRYAARCVESTITQMEESCGVERGSFADSLLAEAC